MLIPKVESVIKRMRWKAHFFINGSNEATNNKFGLKSRNNPPHVKELKDFEEDMLQMIENLEFRNVNDQFLNTLASDAKKIQSTPNVLVFADKTRNIYEMDPQKYNQLLTNNITNYKLY